VESSKAAAKVPQSTRKTRSDNHKLPGKPERLIEQVIESPTKAVTTKRAPKKTLAKKAATPKVMKLKATKATKKSPAKPKVKAETIKKAAADGKKYIATKGKPRPRMNEEPLPSPVGHDDSS
jgi:adenylylsulfate kinase-like enzyme